MAKKNGSLSKNAHRSQICLLFLHVWNASELGTRRLDGRGVLRTDVIFVCLFTNLLKAHHYLVRKARGVPAQYAVTKGTLCATLEIRTKRKHVELN